jgi:hypothetical protein
MNYEGMTVAELVAERDSINVLIKEMREEAKANAASEADAREVLARANVNEGDVVSFLFGSKKEVVEGGKVLKVSEKSVTIESEVFAKGKGYRKYSDILVEVAEEVEDEVAEEVAE